MEGGRRVFLWLLSLWWDGHGWASIEREGPRWVRERGVTASGPQADRRGHARENGKLLSCVVCWYLSVERSACFNKTIAINRLSKIASLALTRDRPSRSRDRRNRVSALLACTARAAQRQEKSTVPAIIKQPSATYGESRVPITEPL